MSTNKMCNKRKYVIFLWNIFFIIYISGEEVGDTCIPNENIVDGVCTLITDCEVALSSIRKKNFHSFERCGFSGDYEIVCCPKTTEKFGKVSERKADIECKRIVESKLVALGLNIYGGEIAALGEFPHMVALGYDRGDEYQFNCGGALISNTFVLTAAHCLVNLERIMPSIVRTGVVELSSNKWNDETDITITESLVHPEYTRSTKYHDVALLRLSKPIKESSTLHAVCLYTNDTDPQQPLIITGWGKTSEAQNTMSTTLLKTNVSAVAREHCTTSYSNWRKLPRGITNAQICAGDPNGGHDTCQGDSGGPLQLEGDDLVYRLVGVTSFGNGCGGKVPGVYTRVAHYLDWIESVVWP